MLCPTQTKIYMRQGQLETSLLQYPYILQKVKKCEDVSREAGDQGHRQDVPPRQVHPAQLPGLFTKTMSDGIVANTSSTWEIEFNPALLPGSKRSAVEREGRPSSGRASPAQDPSPNFLENLEGGRSQENLERNRFPIAGSSDGKVAQCEVLPET